MRTFSSPSIALVIPTYNRGRLICETIDCALNQTLAFDQIIVVDDGSTDDTLERLRKYANQIQIIPSKNMGVQHARNLGVAAATSEYVTLCDSDDLLESDFVASLKCWLNAQTECDIVFCNFVNFNDEKIFPDKFSLAPKGFFEGAAKTGDFLNEIPNLYARTLDYQPLFPTAATFKKSFYLDIGGYDTQFNRVGSEDWEFALRAIGSGNVALMTRPLARIRRHPGNDSANLLHMILGEIKILEFAIKNHSAALGNREKILQSIHSRRIDSINVAFAQGDLNLAKQLFSTLDTVPFNFKFNLKRMILAFPQFMQMKAWKFFQR